MAKMFTEAEVAEMMGEMLEQRVDERVTATLHYLRLLDIQEYLVSNNFPSGWIESIEAIIAVLEGKGAEQINETAKT